MSAASELDEEFRAWLRDVLRRHGWTQAEVAWMIGTHPSTVARWCSIDGRAPRYAQLVALVRAVQELPPSLQRALESSEAPGSIEAMPGPESTEHSGGFLGLDPIPQT